MLTDSYNKYKVGWIELLKISFKEHNDAMVNFNEEQREDKFKQKFDLIHHRFISFTFLLSNFYLIFCLFIKFLSFTGLD